MLDGTIDFLSVNSNVINFVVVSKQKSDADGSVLISISMFIDTLTVRLKRKEIQQ